MINLFICSIEELPEVLKEKRPDYILSVLDPAFSPPSCLREANAHKTLINFHDIIDPVSGKIAPEKQHVTAIKDLAQLIKSSGGGTIVIHCHGGISRSTAAAILLYGEVMGGSPQDWFNAVQKARPRSWPNSRLLSLGSQASNENEIKEALHKHYLIAGKKFPELIPMIRKRGREREIPSSFNGRPPSMKPK